jgi:signal transduction histidine kinase
MNLPSTSDLSLYQLAVDTLAPSQPFPVSPVTLKSLVGALIDVLSEEKIPATLWVKLPPTEDWQGELKRYQQQVGIPQTIYLCNCCSDNLVEVTEVIGQVAGVNGDAQIFPIQLLGGNQLEQEYFLLILSEQLSGLILADCNEARATATLHQSQPWQVICTFEQRVIQRVFAGIKGMIAVADTTPEELLQPWEIQLPWGSAYDEKALLTQLLVKQVQRTEDILHSPTTSDCQYENSPVANDSTSLTGLLEIATVTPPPPNDDLLNKDELLKRVAQELRTPLTNMKTALKLLDSAQLKPAQRQRYMQLLNTQCDRQNSLIAGLLELVQLDSDPQPTVMPSVQLADIVPGVVSTYQPIAQEKGIQLGYTIATSLPSVCCLETWLRVIAINLLHNSLKFTPAGGQVRVRVTLQGEYIQLAISDTGIGIAASEIPRIFDSFYRGRSTTSEDTGAGLGLTIVQRLLLRCGGSISVTSRLGEGSSFKMLLPVASPTAPLCQGRK